MRWSELNLTDRDLLKLQDYLMKHPAVGDIIVGTGGARKTRFALPNKGKSGGARIIYVDVLHDKQIHLLLCYPKSKQNNLTHEQKQQLKAYIKTIKES
jgi:hypothetical protein